MKGGPSIEVLLDLALGENKSVAIEAAEVLKTQVFLYEIDTSRLEKAYSKGNKIAEDIIKSYSKQNFLQSFQKLRKRLKL
jgi:aconitate hydratase 2/2-methylisocitrate dehydratase